MGLVRNYFYGRGRVAWYTRAVVYLAVVLLAALWWIDRVLGFWEIMAVCMFIILGMACVATFVKDR